MAGIYEKVPCIVSHGTEYIEVGIPGTTNSRLEIKFQLTDTNNNYISGGYHYNLYISKGKIVGEEGTVTYIQGDDTADLEVKELVYNFTGSNSTTNVVLFGQRHSSRPNDFVSMKLYYARYYQNDVLVRDFEPVVSNLTGDYGLYDNVSREFFGNAGTGAFDTEYAIVDANSFLADGTLLSPELFPISGTGRYSIGDEATLIAQNSSGNLEFMYWKDSNGNIVSIYKTYSFIVTEPNTRLSAFYNFKKYVRVRSEGGGYATGSGYYGIGGYVPLKAYPNEDSDLDYWERNGQIISREEKFNYLLEADPDESIFEEKEVVIYAVFKHSTYRKLRITSEPVTATIWASRTRAKDGESIDIKARPLSGYIFRGWSDGKTDPNRTIVMQDYDVDLIAYYERIQDNHDIYQYRCYVKDQLKLNEKPKAFMVVDSFDVKNDLLSTANSKIVVKEIAKNINHGDILTLYDPKGNTLYNGVIKKISDRTIQCNQMQNFYAGQWIYNINPQTYLENEIKLLLQDYSQGKMYKSPYIDNVVKTRLNAFTINSIDSIEAHLPTNIETKDDGTEEEKWETKEMESFIYSLYKDYDLMFVFDVNYVGENFVTIKKADYEELKIGNNNSAIYNLSPTTEIEETNRLIIYWSSDSKTGESPVHKKHTYRGTYIAFTDGTIEFEPSSDYKEETEAARFAMTKTKIVTSDDDLNDIKIKELPETMYNHKVTFSMRLKNNLYNIKDFHLGMPLAIYNGTEYFHSVLTGWEFKKNSNMEMTDINFTCGKVRTALTDLLNLGKVVK